jgi:uncharacterized membrane protein YbhN (UPF0104 family)
VVARLSARFAPDAEPLGRLGTPTLLSGLALTACGWVLLGASLASVVAAIRPQPPDGALWLRCVACVAVSWVAGFVASTPGGLGVRELLVQQILEPELHAQAVIAAILLRLLWTAAELAAAAVLYWAPAAPLRIADRGLRIEDRKVSSAPGNGPPPQASLEIRNPQSELRNPP